LKTRPEHPDCLSDEFGNGWVIVTINKTDHAVGAAISLKHTKK